MSLSRAELEAMDRDELVETIVALSEAVDDVETRAEMAKRARENIRDELAELADEVEQLRAENADLRDRLNNADSTAEEAMRVASKGGRNRSKTAEAKRLTRNKLVLRAAKDTPGGQRPATYTEVSDWGETLGLDLQWQIVRNAWDQLLAEWPEFRETTKDGCDAITLSSSDVTKRLAAAVEHDLERDGLTKRFVGENGGGRS